jgi:NAD(P)-dependent dehydrogenase (short-subunit alcohol dehydrogenase family)
MSLEGSCKQYTSVRQNTAESQKLKAESKYTAARELFQLIAILKPVTTILVSVTTNTFQLQTFVSLNSTMMNELKHKRIALITGANQGIGFQVAKELAADGVTVLIGSRNLANGRTAAEKIGAGAIALQLDVTDRLSIATAAAYIRKEFGRLDLLINNAAISSIRKTQLGLTLQEAIEESCASKVSLDELRAVWETNVFGTLAVYQAMLPLLRESSDARIVNVSSGVGSLTSMSDPGNPYHKGYGVLYPGSKSAQNAITLAMMIELEDSNIKVNLVSPGFTKTNLNGYEGTESLEDGSREVVRVALLGPDGSTGTFTRWPNQPISW